MHLLLLAAVAHARTITIEADGSGDFVTVAEAVAAAEDGDELVLGDGTWGPFVLDRAVTVRARGGATTVDGAGAPAIDADAAVTLEGLTLTSAGASAVVLRAGGTIRSSILEGSGGTGVSGGALAVEGGAAVLEDVRFTNNTADTGGAVHVAAGGATLDVSACTFEGNRAGDGGALAVGEGATLSVAGSTFTSNTATNAGGAVYAAGSVVTFDTLTFTENLAFHGGALYATGSTVNTNGVTYTLNTASEHGGSLYLGDASALTEVGGVFSESSASTSGGGMYATGESTIDATGTVFDENTAVRGYGAAVYVYNGGPLRFASCSFAGGLAYRDGGGLYSYSADGDVTVEDCSFTDNVATNGSGGAVYINRGDGLTLTRADISRNEAKNYGGGVAILYPVQTTIDQTIIELNTANTYSGGGLYYDAYSSEAADFLMHDTVVEDNYAAASGGGLMVRYADVVEVHRSDIHDNVTEDRAFGGGLYLRDTTGRVDIGNTSFEGNEGGFGGGMYFEGTAALDVPDDWYNLIFASNRARVGGGACFVRGVSATLRHLTVVGNAATDAAGGLCLSEIAVELGDSVFAHTVSGAALHAFDSATATNLYLTYSNFYGNADGDAGGELVLDGPMAVDPAFARWEDDGRANDSFVLRADSAMRDAGDPLHTDPDGTRADIGAFGGPDVWVQDLDADGWDRTTDCDDLDETTHPGAADEWYDGWDSDCAGNDDDDADGDGAPLEDDCDDTDPTVVGPCDDTDAPDTDTSDTGADPDSDTDSDTDADTDTDAPDGCGCASTGGVAWVGVLGAAAALRRRRP